MDTIDIRRRSGLVFRMHVATATAVADFMRDEASGTLKMVPHPSDFPDFDDAGAIEHAKALGYTQAEDGAWCDPIIAQTAK